MASTQPNIDEVLDDVAWCASVVRKRNFGKKAERAMGMVALRLIDSIMFDQTKDQEETFEKLLARWDRVAERHSEGIRKSLGLKDKSDG